MYSCKNFNCSNSGFDGWMSSKKQNCELCGHEMISDHEIHLKELEIERQQRNSYYKAVIEEKLGRELRENESIDTWKDIFFR
ncbi:hypothetical protein GCM10011514_06640 [Emticicia aquatilis]|uniref:Uncharacterized protein n=1 Tax=Emticicia aquatilis TaxID=1537369 RepID=A0A917DKQ5_9BACT|nr:hypothetical protein GCM10011514_06640 [Emticicia aquatilis]